MNKRTERAFMAWLKTAKAPGGCLAKLVRTEGDVDGYAAQVARLAYSGAVNDTRPRK